MGDIIFGERTKLEVDPAEEPLNVEFRRTYIPLPGGDPHRRGGTGEGVNKILAKSEGESSTGIVAAFPLFSAPPMKK